FRGYRWRLSDDRAAERCRAHRSSSQGSIRKCTAADDRYFRAGPAPQRSTGAQSGARHFGPVRGRYGAGPVDREPEACRRTARSRDGDRAIAWKVGIGWLQPSQSMSGATEPAAQAKRLGGLRLMTSSTFVDCWTDSWRTNSPATRATPKHRSRSGGFSATSEAAITAPRKLPAAWITSRRARLLKRAQPAKPLISLFMRIRMTT